VFDGPSNAGMHHTENQARGHAEQYPWRRGVLGWLIPTATLVAVALFVGWYLLFRT
jgi:hypothetical protein